MFDPLISFYHSLPGVIRWTLDFSFSVIFVRGILANEIMSELKERGIVKRGVLHRSVDKLLAILPRNDRRLAIFEHYRESHPNQSVVDCRQGHCGII